MTFVKQIVGWDDLYIQREEEKELAIDSLTGII